MTEKATFGGGCFWVSRPRSIVTEVEPLEEFYVAEEKHQDYFEKNPADSYCRTYAEPKVKKVRRKFETESAAQ